MSAYTKPSRYLREETPPARDWRSDSQAYERMQQRLVEEEHRTRRKGAVKKMPRYR